jgi:predicted exporter
VGRRITLIAAALCWVWLAVCGGYVGWRFSQGLPVDADIQSLLPAAGADAVERAALDRAARAAAGRIAFLVSGDAAEEAAADLSARLSAGGAFIPDAADGEAMARWLFAHRDQLMCEDPAAFDAEAGRLAARQALARVYSPASPVSGDLLQADPFLRTVELAGCLAPRSDGTLREGEVLLSGRLAQSALNLQTEETVIARFEAWRDAWADRGVSVARSGAVFHAARAAEEARADVRVIGGVGALGVAALFLVAFRRIAAAGVAIGMVAVGTLAGTAAVLSVFPALHVLTLVFAAMLVGVISDYAIHALATGPATAWAPTQARRALIARPITVSMLTTVLGFSALALFGVELFQQVALLAGVGVATAWAFVLFVLLPADRRPARAKSYQAAWRRLEALRARVAIPPALAIGASAALAAAMLYGAINLKVEDDVRTYQPRPADLLAEEAALRNAGYGGASGVFLLSWGDMLEDAKRAEEQALAQAPPEAQLIATTRFDPSAARRAATQAQLQRHLYAPHLASHAEALGLDVAGEQEAPEAEVPALIADLRGEAGGRAFVIAPVLDAARWEGPTDGASRLVNPALAFNAAFSQYRTYALWALGAGLLVALAAVVSVFRTSRAAAIVIPAAIGAGAGLLLPALFGLPLSFFSVAGALVLLGVGIDYAAFEWEAGLKPDHWTSTAVTIDVFTTILSMGLLAVSDTLPVRSFGLTVAIGVAVALCFSYIPRRTAAATVRGGNRVKAHED